MISSRKHLELHGKIIIEKLTLDQSGRITFEFHQEACYIFLRQGGMVINSTVQRTRLFPKDGIALNCGNYIVDFVAGRGNETSEVFAIHLYPELLRDIFRQELPSFLRSDSSHDLPLRTVTDTVMEQFIESLSFYVDNAQIVTEELLVLKMKELVLLLIQSNHSSAIQELFSRLFTRKSISIADVVEAHLYHNLSVSELATLCGLSTTSFKIEFARHFGDSPASYIRKRKVEKAKELLEVSDYTVSEIAEQLGYNDLSHFSKSFQAMCGCSPTHYRNKNISVVRSVAPKISRPAGIR